MQNAYISGPITGVEKYNLPLFNRIEFDLKQLKMFNEIISPANLILKLIIEKENDPIHLINPENYEDILQRIKILKLKYDDIVNYNLQYLKNCNNLILFGNWIKSKSCLIEYDYFVKINNKRAYNIYEVKNIKNNKIELFQII